MRGSSLIVAAAIAWTLPVRAAEAAQVPDGAALFEAHCAACHLADAVPRALAIDNMRALPPAAVVGALTDGAMQAQGAELSAAERRAVAEFIAGSRVASEAAPRQVFAGAADGMAGDGRRTGVERPGVDVTSRVRRRVEWRRAPARPGPASGRDRHLARILLERLPCRGATFPSAASSRPTRSVLHLRPVEKATSRASCCWLSMRARSSTAAWTPPRASRIFPPSRSRDRVSLK